jgi:hypothetical protein
MYAIISDFREKKEAINDRNEILEKAIVHQSVL